MSNTLTRLDHIEWHVDIPARMADAYNNLVDVINALATIVEVLALQVDMITDVLELDQPGVWHEIVDTPDIASYKEPT